MNHHRREFANSANEDDEGLLVNMDENSQIIEELTRYAMSTDDDSNSDSTCSSFDFDEYSSTSEHTQSCDEDDHASHSNSSSIGDDLAIQNSTFDPNKKVKFGSVTIREFEVVLGSYTASWDACPMQLGWKHTSDVTMTIQDHRYLRRLQLSATKGGKSGRKPLHGSLRRLSENQRRHRIAKVQGISAIDVQEMEIKQRSRSLQCLSTDVKTKNSCGSAMLSPPEKLTPSFSR